MTRKHVLIGALIVFVALALGGVRWLVQRNKEYLFRAQTNCGANAKQLSIAMRAYAVDHDSHFPSAATWCDELTPYLYSEQVLICPLARGARASYAMNRSLGAVRVEDLRPDRPRDLRHDDRRETILDPATEEAVDPARVVILFDAPEGWNLAGGPEAVRYRHGECAYFGFADGHYKFSRRDRAYEWRWPQTLASDPGRSQP